MKDLPGLAGANSLKLYITSVLPLTYMNKKFCRACIAAHEEALWLLLKKGFRKSKEGHRKTLLLNLKIARLQEARCTYQKMVGGWVPAGGGSLKKVLWAGVVPCKIFASQQASICVSLQGFFA